jgi:hypothetical protein
MEAESKIILDLNNNLWNLKELSTMEEYYSENIIVNRHFKTSVGIAQEQDMIANAHDAFTLKKHIVNELIQKNEVIVIRWKNIFIHSGKFLNFEPTGKVITFTGTNTYHFRGGGKL